MTRFQSYINEAVLHPNKAILKDLKFMINYIEKYNNKSDFIYNLNDVFKIYYILFKQTKDKDSVNGVGKAEIDLNALDIEKSIIRIELNVNMVFNLKRNNKFKKFADTLFFVIEHELIHREQAMRIHWSKYKDTTNNDSPIEYYGNKHELMAYANTILRSMEANGYTKNDILNFLKNQRTKNDKSYHNIVLNRYFTYFKNNKAVLRLLFKYMYQYLQQED